jgi:hypothetical protein
MLKHTLLLAMVALRVSAAPASATIVPGKAWRAQGREVPHLHAPEADH